MSIILEALKKASVNRNAQTVTRKIETPDGNGFSMPKTMLMAVGAITAVGIVAFLTSNMEREARLPQQDVKLTAEGYAPPVQAPPSHGREGQAPAAAAPKQETTTFNSFITRLSNPHLTLSGIVYGIGKPAAIIENKILEEGASIKGAKITKIHSDSVEMLDEITGQNFVLKVD